MPQRAFTRGLQLLKMRKQGVLITRRMSGLRPNSDSKHALGAELPSFISAEELGRGLMDASFEVQI
jgi:hypothetical protein